MRAAPFETFTQRMDALVGREDDPHRIAQATSLHLAELLRRPEFLEQRYREPGEDTYRQHLIHVHPEGRYSVVSLVWLPGQATPIHDHRSWCIVGVLAGGEREERFTLRERGTERWLQPRQEARYAPGDVCLLVPPDEDIHRVSNAGDGNTISLHVYGADIARWGSSINRTFDELPVRDDADGMPVSWRAQETGATVA